MLYLKFSNISKNIQTMKTRYRLFLPLLILILPIFSCVNKQSNDSEADEKVILGIFGGMGPEATADLYHHIVRLTPAEKDQEHIPTLIYSLPQVPDRMASIRNQDLAIVPYLVEGVTRLENAGASFIAIPCNTVHYYYNYMQEAVSIPIIHMIRETVREVTQNYPDMERIGLLATTGTLESRLYEDELVKNGYEVIVPDDSVEIEMVMKAVFGIKAGSDKQTNEDLLAQAGDHVIKKGAQLIVLGCTEIPLAFNPARMDVPVVNATRVLAERAIQMYQQMYKSSLTDR
jgi:aspartate racemase